MYNDFYKFAISNGVSSMVLDDVAKAQNNYINPTIIEEHKLNVAQMDVFSRLMMERTIFLGTEINDYTANVINAQLLYLDANGDKDIQIYINSPGGIVYSGLAIYDTMNYLNSNVSTICMGLAASMASVLLAAGSEGKRFALPHSRVMIHQPLGGAQGQASDILIAANEIQQLKDELYNILSKHTGQTFDTIWDASDRNNWMTAEQAKNFGLIDSIITKK